MCSFSIWRISLLSRVSSKYVRISRPNTSQREPHHHYEQPLRSRDGTASHNIPEELIFSTGEALFSEAKPTFE